MEYAKEWKDAPLRFYEVGNGAVSRVVLGDIEVKIKVPFEFKDVPIRR